MRFYFYIRNALSWKNVEIVSSVYNKFVICTGLHFFTVYTYIPLIPSSCPSSLTK